MGKYTQTTYDALLRERDNITSKLEAARLAMGAGAEADNNTWHDNPAFEQAKENVRVLETQLLKMNQRLEEAVVVPNASSSTIGVGSTVTVRDNDGESTYHIGGSHIIRDAGASVMTISTASPMGAALMGHAKGDIVAYCAPSGRELTVEIVNVN